jgi:hypothetical protein
LEILGRQVLKSVVFFMNVGGMKSAKAKKMWKAGVCVVVKVVGRAI